MEDATFRRKKVVERWLLEKGLKKRRVTDCAPKNGKVAVNGRSTVYERGTLSVGNSI